MTVKEHLLQLQKSTGIPEPDLIPKPIPAGGQHLWGWFWELDSGRGSNGFGPAELKYTEIEAWSRLMSIELQPIEVKILKEMDKERLTIKKVN